MLNVQRLVARYPGRKIYIDTNIFICVLNGTPELADTGVELLNACARGDLIGLTGELTLAELLVQPLRLNAASAVAAVRELLVESGAVTLVAHERAGFERAALLCAQHGLKMPDALHLTAAQLNHAACLVSNDRRFPALAEIECLSLTG